jgi:hypothetical protein
MKMAVIRYFGFSDYPSNAGRYFSPPLCGADISIDLNIERGWVSPLLGVLKMC